MLRGLMLWLFEEKKDSIYSLVIDIRIKSERAVKTLTDLVAYICTQARFRVDLNLAEKQVTFQLKEINKIYEETDQAAKNADY